MILVNIQRPKLMSNNLVGVLLVRVLNYYVLFFRLIKQPTSLHKQATKVSDGGRKTLHKPSMSLKAGTPKTEGSFLAL
jgi:hypothetical protein